MGSWSMVHWLIVLLIVVLVFGTRKLPNIGKDLGNAMRGFKDGMKNESDKPQAQDAAEKTSRSDSEPEKK